MVAVALLGVPAQGAAQSCEYGECETCITDSGLHAMKCKAVFFGNRGR